MKPDERKERRATLVPAPKGDRVQPLPPIRPAGCSMEFWAGAVGIDRAMSVWESGVDARGQQYGGCVDFFRGISARDRVALADYMIDLWTRFKNGEGPPKA